MSAKPIAARVLRRCERNAAMCRCGNNTIAKDITSKRHANLNYKARLLLPLPKGDKTMKTDKQIEHDALRELLVSPYLGLQEYSTDSAVQRRLGRFLTDASLQVASSKNIEKW